MRISHLHFLNWNNLTYWREWITSHPSRSSLGEIWIWCPYFIYPFINQSTYSFIIFCIIFPVFSQQLHFQHNQTFTQLYKLLISNTSTECHWSWRQKKGEKNRQTTFISQLKLVGTSKFTEMIPIVKQVKPQMPQDQIPSLNCLIRRASWRNQNSNSDLQHSRHKLYHWTAREAKSLNTSIIAYTLNINTYRK